MIIGQRFFGRARQPALNRVRQLTGSGSRVLAEPCLNQRLSRRLRPTLTESGRQDACDPVRYFSQPGRTAGSQLRRARDRISPLTR